MLNFEFSNKFQGLVSPPHFVYDFSKQKSFLCYILLTGEIQLPNYLYFLRYWAICALQLFVSQAVTS